MTATTTLCDHGHVLYGEGLKCGLGYGSGQSLDARQFITLDGLTTYLNCRNCSVVAPTMGYRIPGALGSLIKLVVYTVLRPLTGFVAFFISAETDTAKHPKLAKFGRILTIPRNYSKIEWQCLKGYLYIIFGSNYGRAMIIRAQMTKPLIDESIYSNDFQEVTQLFIPISDAKGSWSDQRSDNYRLFRLSKGDPFNGMFKDTITYQQLINKRYLQIR
jgi:hypothetical protein